MKYRTVRWSADEHPTMAEPFSLNGETYTSKKAAQDAVKNLYKWQNAVNALRESEGSAERMDYRFGFKDENGSWVIIKNRPVNHTQYDIYREHQWYRSTGRESVYSDGTVWYEYVDRDGNIYHLR